jgi:translation initiation factor IF-3
LAKKTRKHKINGEVRFDRVRLVKDGMQTIISSYEAYKIAESEGLDLILISENANPPVVKIEDYQKFLYDIEKSEKDKKKNSNKTEIKEIQLSPNIAENDLLTKAKKAKEFLEDQDKVKCVITLKGRQRSMPAAGELVMLKFADSLSEYGLPESLPKMEGNKWLMILKPKKSK